MKTASKLFLKRGYDEVTVDDIVECAGGSKSTVYQVFGGKCGLFIASMEEMCQEFNAPLRDIDYAGLSLQDSLERFGRAVVALITKKEYLCLHRLVIAEAARCPELGRAWYALGPRATRELIADILRSHPEKPARPMAVSRAAIFFHDALVTDLQHRLLSGVAAKADARSIDTLVRDTVRLFLLGYEGCSGHA